MTTSSVHPAPDGTMTARRVAERSFAHGSAQARSLEQALTLVEGTSQADIVAAIDSPELRIEVGSPQQGGAGVWESPWRPDRIPATVLGTLRGERPMHRVTVDDYSMQDPRELAVTIAHEGSHYALSQRPHLHLPIMAASYATGLASFALSLPTLGLVDLTGRRHAAGAGSLAAAMQGSQLVSAMTHENHAYRVGDRVAVELGLADGGYVLDEDGRELGWARGGWNVAADYMDSAADVVAPESADAPVPGALRMLAMPTLGLGIGTATYLGARRLGLTPPLARAVTFGPGLAAFGWQLLRAD